jgi:tRNA(Ile)-lysidine synthase
VSHPLAIDLAPLQAHPSGALVVALSGGLDSTVLLHALAASPQARARGLRAMHVHHGLHPDADRWQAHCERFCTALDVPLASVGVNVEPVGEGLEAAARRARHAALEASLADGDILALAHHRDDQAETFLLRALRASGTDGLAAMRPWRAMGRGYLWRPLLGLPRAALSAYAQAHALTWIEDPSNADTRFDRNFLRANVLPLLRGRWPDAEAAFARSAALCAQAADLLDEGDAALLAAVRADDDRLIDATRLRELPAARRARVLRLWIATLQLPPLPADGLRCIESELLHARDDAQARFDWHGASVRAWRGLLHGAPSRPGLDASLVLPWDGHEPLHLPDGGALLFTAPMALGSGARVHARCGGERIRLPGRDHSHALKHVLQSRDVAPWTREHLPLLVDDGGLLAAGDVAISDRLSTLLDAAGAQLVWTRPPGA